MAKFSTHLVNAACAVLAVAALGHSVLSVERRAADDLRGRNASAQEALKGAAAAAPSSSVVIPAPPAASADAVLAYLQRSADRTGVQVKVLGIERGQASERKWGESRLRLTIASRYAELKALLADVTGRFSSLSLTSISLRPATSPGGMLDAEIVLVLYHQ